MPILPPSQEDSELRGKLRHLNHCSMLGAAATVVYHPLISKQYTLLYWIIRWGGVSENFKNDTWVGGWTTAFLSPLTSKIAH